MAKLYPLEDTNQLRQALLAAIGLSEIMTERNYIDPFNKDLFLRYTSPDYLNSSRSEMDEIYRMSEVILLHKASGLRAEYLTTESYDGDELRYRVRDVFIITNEGQQLEVITSDFTNEVFDTHSGPVPFHDVKKE